MWKPFFSPRATGRTPFWFWGLVLLAVATAWPALARWLVDVEPQPRMEEANSPSIIASGANSILVRENGRKLWEFSARRIEVSADHRFATATDVDRGVLFRNNKPFVRVQAQRIRVNQESKDWQAEGVLRAQGPDGLTIESKRALWKYQTGQLFCPQPVQATFRGARLTTHGVVYDAAKSQLRCPQPVEVRAARATLRTNAGTQVVADIKRRRVEVQGGVELVIKART
jgi:LPS export ABC transporter protein LptC